MLLFGAVGFVLLVLVAVFSDDDSNQLICCNVCDGEISDGAFSCVHCCDDRSIEVARLNAKRDR